MNRFVAAAFLIAYLILGTFYYMRVVECYDLRVAQGLADQRGTPRELEGRLLNTLAWPFYLFGDATNKLGTFNCGK